MKPIFNQIKLNAPKRNAFDLSHEKKLSFDMGELVPILVQEVVPGDKFKVSTESLVRFAPMLAPMMHRVNVYTHYFYVPNRLVYNNWQDYITGGRLGTTNPTFPTMDGVEMFRVPYMQVGELWDYMGLPIPAASTLTRNQYINALPFRAYQLIYNEYFRDQTLDTAIAITKDDTVTTAEQYELLQLRKRCWEKDYFTSALPWTQRGSDVVVPSNAVLRDPSNILSTGTHAPYVPDIGLRSQNGELYSADSPNPNLIVDNIESIDMSIINLRRAARLQEWFEKNATAGSRYIEQILAHFGVRSSDARLQRPEYLGGGKTPVVISEVVSTVKETTNPQGTMAGHGVSVGNNNGFKKYFEEHGYIIGLISVLPKTAYQQGIPRMYQKIDRYDWFWPEFANIGEQAILNKELYYDSIEATDHNDGVFGYTPRYAEYKFNSSTVHGDFKTSLNYWHMGRIFTARPSLNYSFVDADPTVRPFAVYGGDHLWVQLYNSVKAIRPMPVFGTPTL
jgi:hypothetical protein